MLVAQPLNNPLSFFPEQQQRGDIFARFSAFRVWSTPSNLKPITRMHIYSLTRSPFISHRSISNNLSLVYVFYLSLHAIFECAGRQPRLFFLSDLLVRRIFRQLNAILASDLCKFCPRRCQLAKCHVCYLPFLFIYPLLTT